MFVKAIIEVVDKINSEYIFEKIRERGYYLLDKNQKEITRLTDLIDVYDLDGYRYQIYWYNFNKGYDPIMISKSNKHSIYNVNRFLEIANRTYRCISDKYIDNISDLTFRCLDCKKTFKANWASVRGKSEGKLRYFKTCPFCAYRIKESFHASVLKQVFLHELPDTILEERSCVNPKTNYTMPTDIVNHRLKIAIEIQSAGHDTELQQVKDSIKKKYWIEKGYRFF